MRIALLGLISGVLLGAFGPEPTVTAQTCTNILNNHQSQSHLCNPGNPQLFTTDIFQNNNSEAVLPCIIPVAIVNITSGSFGFPTSQCVAIPGNTSSGNMTVTARRNNECADATYATKVQMPDLTDCNSHNHDFLAEPMSCCQ